MYHIRSWQYRRFHISYLVAWIAVGCLLGLILAKLRWINSGTIVLLVATLGILGALRSRRWWAVAVVMIVGIVLGIDRGGSVLSKIDNYKNYAHTQVLLKGTIDDDPSYGNRGAQQLRLAHITINSQPMVGSVFASTQSIIDVKRGDVVELRGKMTSGFGNYQAKLNYAELVSVTQVKDPVREVRDRFAAGVRNVVSEPAASLGLGFVVGQRSALPDTLDDQLRIVGLTHIVVASGYNLTILVRFMRRLLAKHSKYLAVASSSGLMVLFVAVSGLSPSMTRAALVTGLSLMAWYYGRRFHPLMLIIYTAAATAMVYPIYLWSDIGWYLSFLAFAGVLIIAPLLSSWMFPSPRKVSALAQLLIETLAAQIMTLPLILFIF